MLVSSQCVIQYIMPIFSSRNHRIQCVVVNTEVKTLFFYYAVICVWFIYINSCQNPIWKKARLPCPLIIHLPHPLPLSLYLLLFLPLPPFLPSLSPPSLPLSLLFPLQKPHIKESTNLFPPSLTLSSLSISLTLSLFLCNSLPPSSYPIGHSVSLSLCLCLPVCLSLSLSCNAPKQKESCTKARNRKSLVLNLEQIRLKVSFEEW